MKIIRNLMIVFAVALLPLLTGCTTVQNADGSSHKVVTPLVMVPDGDYEKLSVTQSNPWTGSTTATAGDRGLEVKDGRAIKGGYSVTKTTPFGVSASFQVELRDKAKAQEEMPSDDDAAPDDPPASP